jgi:hypothetical protein
MELIPDDIEPDAFDKMVGRHARQLGEHSLAVVVVAVRNEPGGASGIYFRTAGNHHLAEKAAEDFAARSKIRREARYRAEAEAENKPPDPPSLPGDEWKKGQ